ncbi:MAG: cytochrome P450 [Acidimicrobiales bacterium]
MESTLPPGPRWPPAVQALGMSALPRFLDYCHRRYGDRFTVRMGRFGTFVYFVDPEDIHQVFRGDDAVFHAGEANAPFLGRVLGPSSVLVTDDARHLRQRRRLSGPFHGDSIARLAQVMADVAAKDIDAWPVGRPFPVLEHMRRITMDVILRAVVGVREEDAARLDRLRSTLAALVDLDLLQLAPFAFPQLADVWPWTRYKAVQVKADELLHTEIERCANDPALHERSDVLAMLVRHREDDGTAMTSDEIRDQLVTLLLAGHETTATGLSWTLERLVRHPVVLARAVRATGGGDDAYLDAVVTESLRIRPVVPDITRKLVTDVTIGEGDRQLHLPAGTFVDPAIYLVQRSPDHYPDPLAFRPERFVGQRPDPNVWIPFGGGSRRCLGAAFALTEMRVVLAEVLRRVELEPTSRPAERTRVRHVTLTPQKGAVVTVRQHLPRAESAVEPARATFETSRHA